MVCFRISHDNSNRYEKSQEDGGLHGVTAFVTIVKFGIDMCGRDSCFDGEPDVPSRRESTSFRASRRAAYSDVVGSMMERICEIRFAGNLPSSACLRTIFSSGAM